MAASQRGGYSVTFTVVDNATKELDAIKRRVEQMRQPLDRMQRAQSSFLDTSGLRKHAEGFAEITRSASTAFSSLSRFVPIMGALTGPAAVAGMAALASSTAEMGYRLSRNASELNTTSDRLQNLNGAVRLAGGSTDTMVGSLKALSEATQRIVTGQNPLGEAEFQRAGIAIRDQNGYLRDSTELLPDVLRYLNTYGNAQDRAAVATRIGGRAVHELNEDFLASGRSLDDWIAKQQELGRTLSGDQLAALRRYRESVNELKSGFSDLKDEIGATIAEAANPALGWLTRFVRETNRGAEEGRRLAAIAPAGDDRTIGERLTGGRFDTAPAAPAPAGDRPGLMSRLFGGSRYAEPAAPTAAAPAATIAANENVGAGARGSVEAYLGRSVSDREYDSLMRATHAESGVRNSPEEQAMIMGSILNRARAHPGGIEGALTARNQFQAVTGTRNAPGPSANYVQGPNEQRRTSIEGAASSLLHRVPTSQTNFTAADPRAYGPGTNVGYLSTLNATGGARYGGTQFGGSLMEARAGGGGGMLDTGAAGGGGQGEVPANILATAKDVALSGGPQAVDKFLRSQGYSRPSAWCGAFAASVVKSQGIEPPKNPLIASNWRNWGQPVDNPEGGHVAVRRGARTGGTGSHVTFVESVDRERGTFTAVGGNQGRSKADRMAGLTGRSTYQLADFDFRAPELREALGAQGEPAQVTGGPSVSGSVDVTVTHRNPPPGTEIAARGTGDVDVAPPRIEQQQLTAA